MQPRNASLMSGVPELVVLRLLSERDMYGYEIAQSLRITGGEALRLGEGVLYPALHSLEARGLLRSRKARADGRTRIYYALTRKGRVRLARITEEWRRLAGGVEAILGRAAHG